MKRASVGTGKRVAMLDSLRGGAMVLVMLYHLLYDLAFIHNVSLPDFLVPGHPIVEAVHTGFLWVLFAVSGICSHYSRNLLRRGVLLYLLGFGITLATALFMPDQLIVFGVLSGFGACMVLTALAAPVLDKIPWWLLVPAGVLLWWMFRRFHVDGTIDLLMSTTKVSVAGARYLYPIGITGSGFTSADYFPVIPYVFMYFTGRGLYKPVEGGWLPDRLYHLRPGLLAFIGRHSLLIYVVHQPLLLGILWLVFRIV